VSVVVPKKLNARVYFDKYFTAVEGEPTDDQLARSADALLDLARVAPNASILDLGCGAGFLSIEVARRGYRVVGVDRSDVLLGKARRLAHGSDLDLTFVVGGAGGLSHSFAADLVVAWGGLLGYGSRRRDAAMVRKAASLVRPGGALMITLFNPPYFEAGRVSDCSYSVSRRALSVSVACSEAVVRTLEVGVRSVQEIRQWASPWVRGNDELLGWTGTHLVPLKGNATQAPKKCRYLLYIGRVGGSVARDDL
jgi:SAM-dependent methyltransferase